MPYRFRTFIAVDVERFTRDRLVGLQKQLAAMTPGIRWVEPANLHVTISIDTAHAGNGCLASWFTYKADSQASGSDANPRTVALNNELAAGGNMTVDGHVFMADPNTNQDACKGATINLAYAVNNN